MTGLRRATETRPEYPWPASERNLTNEVSSTPRTFGPSAAISGSSTAFNIQEFRSSSGSFATVAAMRRASSLVRFSKSY